MNNLSDFERIKRDPELGNRTEVIKHGLEVVRLGKVGVNNYLYKLNDDFKHFKDSDIVVPCHEYIDPSTIEGRYLRSLHAYHYVPYMIDGTFDELTLFDMAKIINGPNSNRVDPARVCLKLRQDEISSHVFVPVDAIDGQVTLAGHKLETEA